MSLKVNVGDLIQYRYQPPKDFPQTTVRRVTAVVESEVKGRLGYTVEGGFFVANKDVFTVIPMHEEAPLTSDVTLKLSEQLGGREGDPAAKQSAQPSEHRSLTTSDFPLEAGQ